MAPNETTPTESADEGTTLRGAESQPKPYAAELAPDDAADPTGRAPRKRATRRTTKKAAVAIDADVSAEAPTRDSVDRPGRRDRSARAQACDAQGRDTPKAGDEEGRRRDERRARDGRRDRESDALSRPPLARRPPRRRRSARLTSRQSRRASRTAPREHGGAGVEPSEVQRAGRWSRASACCSRLRTPRLHSPLLAADAARRRPPPQCRHVHRRAEEPRTRGARGRGRGDTVRRGGIRGRGCDTAPVAPSPGRQGTTRSRRR